MAFRIEWKKSTRKDLRKLPAGAVDRVVEAVEELSQNPFPHGADKLTGSEHAIAFGWAITRSFTKSSRSQNWWKSSVCDTARTFIGFDQVNLHHA
jgi:hypothetical protein